MAEGEGLLIFFRCFDIACLFFYLLDQAGKILVVGRVFFHDWMNIFDLLIILLSFSIGASLLALRGDTPLLRTAKILQLVERYL